MTGRWTIGVAAAALAVLVGGPAAAQQAPSWVEPAYPTTPPEDKVLTMVDIHHYQERRFEPPIAVEPIPPGAESFATPEQAFLSRFSAMMRGDYELFMATWDDASRVLTEARDIENGQTPDFYVANWKSIFDAATATLVRRIDAGDYVILTYKYVMPDGTELIEAEFPGMFREYDDGWRATQELSKDDLPVISPWVSGETEVTQIAR